MVFTVFFLLLLFVTCLYYVCVVGVCCRDFSVSLSQKIEALSGSCVIIKCTFEIREQYEKYLTEKATTGLWLKDGTEEDKHCAEQLTDVLTDIFNISLSHAVVPTCFKSTTITPSTKEVTCVLPERLSTHSTDPNHDEVLWEVSHAPYQIQSPQHTWPASVCIPSKPLHGRCHFLHQVSSATMMKHHTERKWHNWLNGVGANNLSLNVSKTKQVVMDFRRNSVNHPPLTIDSSTVERVSSTKFLGVHITEDLTWITNTTSFSKKAQQRLHFLRRLKRASLPPPILTFYRGTIESVLTSCIAVWYGNCSAADRKTLQRTVNTAAKIIGAPLPSILDIFLARCSSKATSIVKDPTHPSHSLF